MLRYSFLLLLLCALSQTQARRIVGRSPLSSQVEAEDQSEGRLFSIIKNSNEREEKPVTNHPTYPTYPTYPFPQYYPYPQPPTIIKPQHHHHHRPSYSHHYDHDHHHGHHHGHHGQHHDHHHHHHDNNHGHNHGHNNGHNHSHNNGYNYGPYQFPNISIIYAPVYHRPLHDEIHFRQQPNNQEFSDIAQLTQLLLAQSQPQAMNYNPSAFLPRPQAQQFPQYQMQAAPSPNNLIYQPVYHTRDGPYGVQHAQQFNDGSSEEMYNFESSFVPPKRMYKPKRTSHSVNRKPNTQKNNLNINSLPELVYYAGEPKEMPAEAEVEEEVEEEQQNGEENENDNETEGENDSVESTNYRMRSIY